MMKDKEKTGGLVCDAVKWTLDSTEKFGIDSAETVIKGIHGSVSSTERI